MKRSAPFSISSITKSYPASLFLIAPAADLWQRVFMTAEEIIQSLGGTGSVALATGRSRNAVSNWTRYGIPGRFWPLLVREAKSNRVRDVTMETMEQHTYPLSKRNAAYAKIEAEEAA